MERRNDAYSPLAVGRNRWSRAHNLRSLMELCIRAIINNLPHFFIIEQPFSGLPVTVMTVLMEKITKYLDARRIFCDIEISSQLIAWNLTTLHVHTTTDESYQFSHYNEITEAMLKTLLKKMEKVRMYSLRHLTLDVRDVPAGLLDPLRSFHALRLFQITVRTGATDSLLSFIGANLPQIRALAVPVNNFFSDTGLGYLCMDDGIHGKCKQLIELRFNTFGFAITSIGITALLDNLPHLRYIGRSDYALQGVLNYALMHPDKPLKLKGIVSGHFSTKRCRNTSDLETLFKTAPNLERIHITGNIPIDIQFLNEIKCKEFKIQFSKNNMSFDLHDFIKIVGHKITYLNLEIKDYNIDVSIIARYCPKLVRFYHQGDSEINMEFDTKCFENAFRKVELISIVDVSVQNPFPTEALYAILCSRFLKYTCFYKVTNLRDALLDQVFRTSVRNPEVLAEMREFIVYSCNGRQLSNESRKKILACCPKEVSMYFPEQNNSEIQRFLFQIRPWDRHAHSFL